MKTSKKIISMILCLVMLCSIMSISAFADSADPEVTVYVTTGMYTAGGYDPDHGMIDQTLIPADPNYYLFDEYYPFAADEMSIAEDLDTYRAVYNSNFEGDVNVLDAIIFSLMMNGYDCLGGWDSITVPNGGYVHAVFPNGTPAANHNRTETIDGVTYTVYSGTGWRIAVKYPGGDYVSIENYATEYEIVDGMEIIFDLSYYEIYAR